MTIRTVPRKKASRRARTDWDAAIDVWDDFQEAGLDYSRDFVHGPGLLRAIGPVRGRRVLDLGCGQGRFTRLLARSGGKVTAVDWSRPMIDAARARESREPLGIDYRLRDARVLGRTFRPHSFHLVVSCMAFMDMPDLPRVLRAARHWMRDDGRLVFSVTHPMNTAAEWWERDRRRHRGGFFVDRYFDERVVVTEWRMRRLLRPFDTLCWHRTFEEWFALLDSAGFRVESLTEPRATAAQVRKIPLLKRSRLAPFFLVVRCRAA